jgi:autotransporter adhesin
LAELKTKQSKGNAKDVDVLQKTAYNKRMSLEDESTVTVTDGKGDVSVDLAELKTKQSKGNADDIATNTLKIDTNTREISKNRNNIQINSHRISSNTHRISRVERKVKYVNVTTKSAAIGNGAQANAQHSVAIGNGATVESSAEGSVALGTGARVNEGVTNSVALGQYSVASESNTVSVGNNRDKRRITNVADGVDDNDAVNMRQYNYLDTKVNRLDSKINGIGAMSSAMSALIPNPRSDKDTQLSLGLGHYKSETAIAFGVFDYVEDDVLLNAGASYSKETGTAFRMGITWGI